MSNAALTNKNSTTYPILFAYSPYMLMSYIYNIYIYTVYKKYDRGFTDRDEI